MKKLLMTFICALAVLCFFALPSGTASAENNLPAPANPNVTENGDSIAFVWDNVDGNFGYNAYVNDVKFTVSQNVTKLDVSAICTEARPYTLTVYALDEDGVESVNFAEYTLSRAVKLATPVVNGVSDAKVFSWTAVSNAASYSLVVNGVEVASSLTVCKFDLTSSLANAGDYTLRVAANGDGFYYLDGKYSASFVYTNKLTLDTPTNLSIASSEEKIVASWDRVPFSDGYVVTVDGTDYTAESNSFDLTTYVFDVKDYDVLVKAKANGNFLESAAASTTHRTISTLAAPELSLSGTSVSWTSVENASTYSVKVNDTLCTEAQTETSFNLSTICAAPGTYTIKVAANANGNYSQSTISTIDYNNFVKLATPAPTIKDSIVSWIAIPNADKYSLYIDGVLKDSQIGTTEVDLTDYCVIAANYTIEISANANGYYSTSDKGSVNYAHYVSHQPVVLDADGLTISWLAVSTADSYTVTVDGVVVADNCTDTTYDLTEELTENKAYTVGVYANAKDYFTDGEPATISICGVASQSSSVTYTLRNYSYCDTHIVFVDGVRSDIKPTADNKLTLPSTATYFAIVEEAEAIYNKLEGAENRMVVYYKLANVNTAIDGSITLEYDVKEASFSSVDEAEEEIRETSDGYCYHYMGGSRYYPID